MTTEGLDVVGDVVLGVVLTSLSGICTGAVLSIELMVVEFTVEAAT